MLPMYRNYRGWESRPSSLDSLQTMGGKNPGSCPFMRLHGVSGFVLKMCTSSSVFSIILSGPNTDAYNAP